MSAQVLKDRVPLKIKNRRKSLSNQEYHPHFALTSYTWLIFILLYLPIISVIVFSFNSSKSVSNWGGFSFTWYESLFKNRVLMEDLRTTLSIAAIATVFSTIIGTLGAIGLAELNKKKPKFVNFVLSVNNLPLVNPDIVTAVSLMTLFLAIQSVLEMGYITLLLAHIAFCTPYIVIQVYPKVLSQDPSEIEAAMDLGATRRQAVMKVMIPDLMPSILSGAMLAFTMSFDDFIISYFVGGKSQNISVYIYSMKTFSPIVNALSTIIFLAIGLVVLGFQVFNSTKKKREER